MPIQAAALGAQGQGHRFDAKPAHQPTDVVILLIGTMDVPLKGFQFPVVELEDIAVGQTLFHRFKINVGRSHVDIAKTSNLRRFVGDETADLTKSVIGSLDKGPEIDHAQPIVIHIFQ